LNCDKYLLIFLAFDGNSNEFSKHFDLSERQSNPNIDNPNSNKKQNSPQGFFDNIRDGFKEIFNVGSKLD